MKILQLTLRRRWPLLILSGALAVGLTGVGLKLRGLVHDQLPGILQQRLEAALHRPVRFGRLTVWPNGVWIEDFRVPRAHGESVDPLTAQRLRVSADWWELLTTRRVRVTAVDLDGARLRLTQGTGAGDRTAWTRQVLGLSAAGMERIGLRGADLNLLKPDGRVVWAAHHVEGDLFPAADRFSYRARVGQLDTPRASLLAVRLAGSGDARALRLDEGRADYGDGRFEARGALDAAGGGLAATVRVRDLSLAGLAPQLGVPKEWAMVGRLTGEVTVDARDNSLRLVEGLVSVSRASVSRAGSRLPWDTARARVRWTPAGMDLEKVNVTGPGLSLAGSARVATPAREPLPRGRFTAEGELRAHRSTAVAAISEILGFRKLMGGRWTADSASVRFQADGTVGDLAHASATGDLSVGTLRFRPDPRGDQILVDTVSANLERRSGRLHLSSIRAQTHGLSLTGGVTVTAVAPGKPGEFTADGIADVRELRSLRRVVPQAALWKWIPSISDNSRGRVVFRLGGPTAQDDLLGGAGLWSDGRFEVRDFRLSARTPLPGGGVLSVPVNVVQGAFRHRSRRFEATDLRIDARTFDATGQMSWDFSRGRPVVSTDLKLVTKEWRRLPGMPPGALPELTGGRLEATLSVTGEYARLARVPVDGSFRLLNASYTSAHGDGRPLPVRELAARFRWVNATLELPYVVLDSPQLVADAAGRIYSDGSDYHLALDIDARSTDSGDLVALVARETRLAKGTARARFHVDAPIGRFVEATVAGSLRLDDVSVLQSVALLGRQTVEASKVEADFTRHAGRWDVSRMTLESPGLLLSLKGSAGYGAVDAELALESDRWEAPEKLPISGGSVSAAGRLRAAGPESPFTFTGEVRMKGARARYASSPLSIAGGSLNVTARGEGPLSKPGDWIRSGELELTQAKVTGTAGREAILGRLAGSFVRDGERYNLTDGRLEFPGLQASASGHWTPAGHHLVVSAGASTLDALGFAGLRAPDNFQAREYNVEAVLDGDRSQLIRAADLKLDLRGARVVLGNAPAQEFDRVSGSAKYSEGTLRLDSLTGKGAAGTFLASGEWTKSAHRLSAEMVVTDLSKLGVTLPEGFSAGEVRIAGDVAGTPAELVARSEGRVTLAGVGIPFGPEGSHHLDRVSARFTTDGKKVQLSEMVGDGPAGRYTGSGEITERAYRLSLFSALVDPRLARWLVPGTVEGGKLSGTLVLEGGAGKPVRTASGRFELKDAIYTAPATLELIGARAAVARLAGDYRWESGRTVVSGLVLASDVANGAGTLTTADGRGRLQADLSTTDAGRVSDFWPTLAGKLHGAKASGKLDAQFGPDGITGEIALSATGGKLVLPSVPGEYAEHPIDTASLVLGFQPQKLTFTGVTLRGPKGNADGAGAWTSHGPVWAKGKAWFSKSYTSKMIRPSGWGWLAKLAGIRQVKSDFTLGGTSDRVTLNADITKGLLWKFAKGTVPKEFQAIAAGKAPLWISPVEPATAVASTRPPVRASLAAVSVLEPPALIIPTPAPATE